MTRSLALCSRPEICVIALCEMWSSSRFVRVLRLAMLVRRLDWMERIVRFVRVWRPCGRMKHVRGLIRESGDLVKTAGTYLELCDLVLA